MVHTFMLIGRRLRGLREAKNLSQHDIEKRCGLLRPYISRIEHGYTAPTLKTLEKMARALEVPLHHVFYAGEEMPQSSKPHRRKPTAEIVWGNSPREILFWRKLRNLLTRINDPERQLFLQIAQKMARR